MILRKADQGSSSAKSLWNCSAFPDCRGTREIA
jgi:hypothetical protein